METTNNNILAINGGSSSIKFALFQAGESLKELFHGQLEGIGRKNSEISFTNDVTSKKFSTNTVLKNHKAATDFLISWLEKEDGFDCVHAIGHRIVYGKNYTEPAEISTDLMNELSDISIYDPEHLPGELYIIETFRKKFPAMKQIACFDTSFHACMPPVAKMIAIPRRYYDVGIHRYGFHGLSYAYLMDEIKRTADHKTAHGKIILAHLGNGASIAAVKDGKSMDTSMGFTPTSGLPMSTRTGDIDPGVALYLMKTETLDPKQFNDIINHQSGLLGVSGTSSDMRDLLKCESTDNRAAQAIDLFCYQTKKWIGSFAAALGGLDILVFSGGIGENAPEVRARICSNLEFLGIELDDEKNLNNEPVISKHKSKIPVFVMKTNEELMIAKLVCQFMHYNIKN